MATTTFEKIHGQSPKDAGLTQEQARDYEVKEATKVLYAKGVISEENYQEARNVLSILANQVSVCNL